MTIRHNCNDNGCYLDQLPDWAMLDGCFGKTRVKASDIDGVVYQNGRFLFLEKKFPLGYVDQPQMRAIRTLVEKGYSWIVFWCERSDGRDISMMRVFGIEGYDSTKRISATYEDFRAAVKAWWTEVYEPGCV